MTEDELDSDLADLIDMIRPDAAARLNSWAGEQRVIYQGAWTPGRKENGSWMPGQWRDVFWDDDASIEPFVILEQI